MTELLSFRSMVAVNAFKDRMMQYANEKSDTDVFIVPLPFTIRGEAEIEKVKQLLTVHFDHVRTMDVTDILHISFSRK